MTLEQLAPYLRQRGAFFCYLFDFHRHTCPVGKIHQFPGSLSGLLESQQMGIHTVTVQADGNTGGNLHQMGNNRHILPGKVREAVYVKDMLLAEAALLQLFQQPGHLVSGVPLAPATEGIIALHQHGQLLQLLGKAAVGFPGGGQQVFGGNAAALKFVHAVNKAG